MAETLENIVTYPLIPASRITVHNATGAKLSQGQVVKLTGSETNGIPNVAATTALSDVPLGVLFEDIENGEDGICVVGQEVVKVVVNADVTQGNFAGLSTTAGRVENLGTVTPGAGTTKRVSIVGLFIGGARTQAAGDKVDMLILHGYYVNTGT